MRPVFFVVFFVNVFIYVSCGQLKGKSFVPSVPGYDESGRKIVVLKKPLREISGIDYTPSGKLVAINDEAGKIFLVDPATGGFEVFEFGEKGDYEDVVVAGDYFYVLRSDGHIFQVNVSNHKQVDEFENDFGKHTEFESLYYDKTLEQLVLICKECGKHSSSVNAYRFDLNTKKFVPGIYFTIEWKEIRRMAKNNQIECKPSAAAINPVTNKLFIIASVGKVLLQCSRQGVLERVYAINSYHFQQPEGITFAPNGDMYISNEGAPAKGSILFFPYSK